MEFDLNDVSEGDDDQVDPTAATHTTTNFDFRCIVDQTPADPYPTFDVACSMGLDASSTLLSILNFFRTTLFFGTFLKSLLTKCTES